MAMAVAVAVSMAVAMAVAAAVAMPMFAEPIKRKPTKKKRKMDEKDFGIGAQMIHAVGISKIKLLSNSEQIKRVGMSGYGLEIVSYEMY